MTDLSNETGNGVVALADIGGTNVRFALLADGITGSITHIEVGAHKDFADAFAAFMARQSGRAAVRRALLAVAGVVEGERCALTNNPWVIDAGELRARFGLTDVRLVNDFEAIAWSLPRLKPGDLRPIGGSKPVAQAPMVVLGPGTGLGVAAYVPLADGGLVLRGEGGHSTLPSGSAREDAIIGHLRQRYGHVSAERVLSGPGLENLYRAIAALDSLSAPKRSAAEITEAALAGQCAASAAALDTFCAMLGDVASNFALAFGAQGGVFMAGGILPRLGDHLPKTQFRARFDAKGRMRRYVEQIPVYLILRDDPAFVGLQRLTGQPA